MTEINQNVFFYKGEAKTIIIPVLRSGGAPVDISAATLLYRVSLSPAYTTPIINKTENEIVVSGPGHNVANIPIEHADTTGLQAYDYYHELRVIDPSGIPDVVVMTGKFTVADSSTSTV